jgi:homogentisate 1,2-dioxygenase
VGPFDAEVIKIWDVEHRHHHFRTAVIVSSGNAVDARKLLFHNADISISKAHINKSMDYLYHNGQGDELIFIHSGSGILKTNFGKLDLRTGDYVVIPRGVIWKMSVNEEIRTLIIESTQPIETPERYRNRFGQLLEHSPFCERDIRTPVLEDFQISGKSVEVITKVAEGFQQYKYASHPFDVVGWDGYYYPWIFNIYDFEPITGRLHQPPPVHQTFQSHGFVVCSFVPRLYDYHPEAIPAPYAHSNVDSDEILYYIGGSFMSRKGIEPESITYHPMGLPHGPQPGKIEESINQQETNEIAVMIDTFKPLKLTDNLKVVDDKDYPKSWLPS